MKLHQETQSKSQASRFREIPPGLLQHVLTVLVFWSWFLLLPWLPPWSRSLRLSPWASILLYRPLEIAWMCCPQLPHHPCKNGTHSTCFYSTGGHAPIASLDLEKHADFSCRWHFPVISDRGYIFGITCEKLILFRSDSDLGAIVGTIAAHIAVGNARVLLWRLLLLLLHCAKAAIRWQTYWCQMAVCTNQDELGGS